jgi:hypothetical protein
VVLIVPDANSRNVDDRAKHRQHAYAEAPTPTGSLRRPSPERPG